MAHHPNLRALRRGTDEPRQGRDQVGVQTRFRLVQQQQGLRPRAEQCRDEQQLSARFAYAAAMKSINNLLLLGDGETWSRQSVDFGGLPEMIRTFLQVAAGAADIPVTRLLGQSPAGLSATGDSDTRNYYDMIAARQEIDLRPQLEGLDRLIARSEGLDPGTLSFAFRPLWQLDAPSQAALALQKAQATQIYAGLKLWPAEVTARLAEAQLVADGTYPNAAAVFGEGGAVEVATTDTATGAGALHCLTEPRDLTDPGKKGQWTAIPIADDCSEEWTRAYRMCADLPLRRPGSLGVTGGYWSLADCARGLVSERCGGNAVSWRRRR